MSLPLNFVSVKVNFSISNTLEILVFLGASICRASYYLFFVSVIVLSIYNPIRFSRIQFRLFSLSNVYLRSFKSRSCTEITNFKEFLTGVPCSLTCFKSDHSGMLILP